MKSNPLRHCLHRLTHLSGRSRVLRLLKLPLKQCIDLHEMNFAYPKRNSFAIIDELIAHKNRIALAPFVEPNDSNSHANSQRLLHILRSDRTLLEERGDRALSIGWPIVQGQFNDGYVVRCPLLFFSVHLQYTAQAWQLSLRGDSPIALNRAFVLAYCQHHALSVPAAMWDEDLEAYPRDSRAFLTKLYHFLKESPIQAAFGVAHFEEQLTPFKAYSAADLEANTQRGHLGLQPNAVLGLFPQGNISMMADYAHLLELDLKNPFEELFCSYTTRQAKAKDFVIPLPLDAAQEAAFARVKEGKNWVVQGPPGTGKSQLITALIADAMANKKRVALVCQKRAALEVIYRRLQALGASDFVGYVCDVKHERAALYESIYKQIELVDKYKQSGASAEMITLERNFKQLTTRLSAIEEYFTHVQKALYDTQHCGQPIKVLYLRTQATQKVCDLNQYYKQFPYADLPDFLFTLRTYARYAKHFHLHALWHHRQSFASHNIQDLSHAMALIDEVGTHMEVKLPAFLKETTWHKPPTLTALEQGVQRRGDLQQLINFIRTSSSFQPLFESALGFDWLNTPERKMYLSLLQAIRGATQALEASLAEKRYAQSELQDLQNSLAHAQRIARKGRILALAWYHLWGRGRKPLSEALEAHHLRFDPKGLQKLRSILACQAQWYDVQNKAQAYSWPFGYEEAYPPHIKDALPVSALALRIRALTYAIRFKQLWKPPLPTSDSLLLHLQNTQKLLNQYTDLRLRCKKYFTDVQIGKMLASHAYREEIKASLAREFEDLCAFDRLKESMREVEHEVITHLYAEVQVWDAKPLVLCFEESLAQAWIGHIEDAYPCLRDIGTLHFDEKIREYRRLVEERRKLSAHVLGLRLQERTYEHANYTHYAGKRHLKSYRALRQQVQKKRRLWPVRQLMAHMNEELFCLMPCWLLTPSAASSIFSMDKSFDLVLFDEASQCFVEHALPIMYRAHQFVVIGDSQQLPPNELYQGKWQDLSPEDEEILDESASLLEAADKYLPSTYLSGHYRSQQLDLIQFSNQYLYDYRLDMLPHFESVCNYTPSIRYVNVRGVWDNHVNRVEAKKVIELIVQCLKESTRDTLGVVTFNLPQQECIWNALDEAKGLNHQLSALDWARVSVKNIENVQGDEFDIVIFSIGYAPGAKGGAIRRAFGSLSQPGGHKRLNVAITRAIRRMYIVCSIQPEELRIDDLNSDGGRMLGQYLAYAYEVAQGQFKPTRPPIDTPPNERLSHVIAEHVKQNAPDHHLKPLLPYADLTYMANQKPKGLVFTDDKPYYELRTPADIYVHRPAQLKARGWAYTQMYSRTYWINKADCLANMWKDLGKV